MGNFLAAFRQLFTLLTILLVRNSYSVPRKRVCAQYFGFITLTHWTEPSWHSDLKKDIILSGRHPSVLSYQIIACISVEVLGQVLEAITC